jgi:uncharacterized protein (TIGR02246 family)
MASIIVAAIRAEERVTPNADVRAIRTAGQEYASALGRGDLSAIRQMWTPDGDYIDASGQRFKAKEMIVEHRAASAPNSTRAQVAALDSSIRLLSPDVAIEDGTIAPGSGNTSGGRFTAIWVKREGRWLLDSLRESVSVSRPTNEHLQALEWLLGEWVGATDDAVILISSNWSDDGKYISREFLVRSEGRDDITATQRIGWDASGQVIRCWTFDSQGGRSESIWRKDGRRWIAESIDVLPDGQKSQSLINYNPIEDGRFVSELNAKWSTAGKDSATASLPTLRVEFWRAVEDE